MVLDWLEINSAFCMSRWYINRERIIFPHRTSVMANEMNSTEHNCDSSASEMKETCSSYVHNCAEVRYDFLGKFNKNFCWVRCDNSQVGSYPISSSCSCCLWTHLRNVSATSDVCSCLYLWLKWRFKIKRPIYFQNQFV